MNTIPQRIFLRLPSIHIFKVEVNNQKVKKLCEIFKSFETVAKGKYAKLNLTLISINLSINLLLKVIKS